MPRKLARVRSKDAQLSVRLASEIKEAIVKIAASEGVNVSKLVRKLVVSDEKMVFLSNPS